MATITTRKALTLDTDQSFEGVEVRAQLTSADILTLNSVPVVLVAGVAGKTYWPTAAFYHYDAGAVAYANFNTGFQIKLGGVTFLDGSASPLTVADVDAVSVFGTGLPIFVQAPDFDGAPLLFICDTADPTLGNGTLELIVLYRAIDVP